MKQKNILLSAFVLLVTACSPSEVQLSPEKLSDTNWKNGIWTVKDGRNGFFISADAGKVQLQAGTRLKFAKSGERTVTAVSVTPPYINIFVDKPLDPDGDGFPNKVVK
jgi:hypothetical protein